MARLPVISGDELVNTFGKIGYAWDHTEGSHMILLHPSGRRCLFQDMESWGVVS